MPYINLKSKNANKNLSYNVIPQKERFLQADKITEVIVLDPLSPNYVDLDSKEGLSATKVGRYVFFYGGNNARKSASITTFDLRNNKFVTFNTSNNFPFPRAFHSATSLGNSLWIFGGETSLGPNNKVLLSEVWCLHTIGKNWVRKSSGSGFVEPRKHHSAFFIGNYLVICGGEGENTQKLADFLAFNTKDNSWMPVSHQIQNWGPISHHTATGVFSRSTKIIDLYRHKNTAVTTNSDVSHVFKQT